VLREDQARRYARHILLPDIGGVGQKRLLAAVVLVELGLDPAAESVALAYLAAAGVGHLVLAGDVDAAVTSAEARVAILLGASDIGRPRIDAMTQRIAALNPDVRVERASTRPAGAPAPTPLAPPISATPALAALPASPGSAVADALVRGGARAVRTLSQLAKPDGAIEPS
jgi:molybdopterin/thiamine biosynthesis adenylyltransferase